MRVIRIRSSEYEGWTRGCDKTRRYTWAPPIKKRRYIDELEEGGDDVSSRGVNLNENASSTVDTLNVSGESLFQAN